MEQVINWTLTDGDEATVTVRLQLSKEINCDGDVCCVDCCDLSVTGETAKRGTVGSLVCRMDHPEYAGRCGQLGIREEQMLAIEAAISTIKAMPEWQAKMAREQAAEIMHAEYNEHMRKMARAMAE